MMQVSSEDVLCIGVFPLPGSLCFQWEGVHFAGEPSPKSVLQGVLVQEAKELFGGGLKGCLAQRKIVSFIISLQISSQSHK